MVLWPREFGTGRMWGFTFLSYSGCMSLWRVGTIVVLWTTLVAGCTVGDDSATTETTIRSSSASTIDRDSIDPTTTATASDDTGSSAGSASTIDRDSIDPTTTATASDDTGSSAGSGLASTTVVPSDCDGRAEYATGESRDINFFRSQYLSVMEPLNCALERLDAAQIEIMGDDHEVSDDEWPEVKGLLNEAMATYGHSLVEAITRLDSLEWTPELDADVATLASELNQAAGVALQGLAQAETVDQWRFGMEAWNALPHSAAAAMQAKLGL